MNNTTALVLEALTVMLSGFIELLQATISKSKVETLSIKIIAVFLFVGLISRHFQIFGNLGLGRYYWYNWN